ncbi:hypothetical protein [Rhodococcus sp. NPDC004095]
MGLIAPLPRDGSWNCLHCTGIGDPIQPGAGHLLGVCVRRSGVIFGNFGGPAIDLFSARPALAVISASGAATAADFVAAFLATSLSMVGHVASIAGVQIVNGVRSEELDNRVELVLAMELPSARRTVPRSCGVNAQRSLAVNEQGVESR